MDNFNFSCLSKALQGLKIGSQLVEYIMGWPNKGPEGSWHNKSFLELKIPCKASLRYFPKANFISWHPVLMHMQENYSKFLSPKNEGEICFTCFNTPEKLI